MCRYAQRSQAASDILPKSGCGCQSKPRGCDVIRASSASSSATIGRELGRPRAAQVLIDLRIRANAARPGDGQVQDEPFENGTVNEAVGASYRLLTDRHAERIGEVADHLVR